MVIKTVNVFKRIMTHPEAFLKHIVKQQMNNEKNYNLFIMLLNNFIILLRNFNLYKYILNWFLKTVQL
jgi:hypothetical protein